MTSRGVALILAQQACFSVNTAIVHHLHTVPVAQQGLAQSIGGLLLALCLAPSRTIWRTPQLPLQLIRGLINTGYMIVAVYSFSHLPFADATAISYTQALYVVLFAPLLLGEPASRGRWLAVSVGIAGALLIIRPGVQASWLYAAIVAGTSLNAVAFLLNKRLGRRDPPVTILAYVHGVMLLAFLPVALIEAVPPVAAWPWLAASAAVYPVGTWCGIAAVRYADAAALAPFLYGRLVLAMAFALAVFGEVPDVASVAGAVAIVVACVMASGSVGGLGEQRRVET